MSYRDQVDEFAKEWNVPIPLAIPAYLSWFPVVKVLADRIRELEAKVKELERQPKFDYRMLDR